MVSLRRLLLHVLVRVRVEEQRVHAPGERLGAPIEEVVGRGFGKFTAVFVLDVLDVGSVLDFGVVDPGGADSDSRDANVETDLPPQVSGLSSMMLQSSLLRKVLGESRILSGGGKLTTDNGTTRCCTSSRTNGSKHNYL